MKISVQKLISIINESLNSIKTISIIMDNVSRLHFAVYLDDLFICKGYELELNGVTVNDFHELVELLISIHEDILIFQFYDIELFEVWKESYIEDEGMVFHKYNNLSELFCIDYLTYCQIVTGSQHINVPEWKQGIIDFYRGNVLGGEKVCLKN